MEETVVIQKLLQLGWSPKTLEVWRRAGYRCEYCWTDLLASDAEYFYGSQVDHVLPKEDNTSENLALACKACNFIKRDKDFSTPGATPEREAIIGKARRYILERRQVNCQRLNEVRELLRLLDNPS